MEFSDLSRRGFLKQSATAAAVGASLSAGSVSAVAARSRQEVEQWRSRVGQRFQADDVSLRLRSVVAKDYSGDAARPTEIRTHSISVLFVVENGDAGSRNELWLNQDGEKLCLFRVVPPEGDNGQFFELTLN